MLNKRFLSEIFPPPKMLTMPYVGLDISDNQICFAEMRSSGGAPRLVRYGSEELPKGIVEGGDVLDSAKLIEIISGFAKKNKIHRVKVSLAEEKVYLFQTTVPSSSIKTTFLNIESKIEENVPIKANDAIFSFDIIDRRESLHEKAVSVSVLQTSYSDQYRMLLEKAGLQVIAFESAPHALVRSTCTADDKIYLIAHFRNNKIGLYISFGNIILFSSTVSLSLNGLLDQEISKEDMLCLI
jgi:Tfp pilus assembly PilM family ATPase